MSLSKPNYRVAYENTLGMYYDESPGTFYILGVSVLRGSMYIGRYEMPTPAAKNMRQATKRDFKEYRVECSDCENIPD